MISIRQETSYTKALEVLNAIPEFKGTFSHEYLAERLNHSAIVLLAYDNNKAIGCKIAYDRYSDGSLYSWLGGILPDYRKMGVAQKLQLELETIAIDKNYTSIIFKTRNKFKAMLHFGLNQGFEITGFEAKPDSTENRILLKKVLSR